MSEDRVDEAIMIFLAIIVVGFLAMAGYAAYHDATLATSEPQLILTQDGCNVYRFYDAGHSHYFSNCPGSVSTPEYREGRHHTEPPEEVPTAKPDDNHGIHFHLVK